MQITRKTNQAQDHGKYNTIKIWFVPKNTVIDSIKSFLDTQRIYPQHIYHWPEHLQDFPSELSEPKILNAVHEIQIDAC